MVVWITCELFSQNQTSMQRPTISGTLTTETQINCHTGFCFIFCIQFVNSEIAFHFVDLCLSPSGANLQCMFLDTMGRKMRRPSLSCSWNVCQSILWINRIMKGIQVSTPAFSQMLCRDFPLILYASVHKSGGHVAVSDSYLFIEDGVLYVPKLLNINKLCS